MNAFHQLTLDLDSPSSGTLQTEKVAQVPAKEPRKVSRRRYRWTEIALREREGYPPPRFLSWQSERAWEVGIPPFGPI